MLSTESCVELYDYDVAGRLAKAIDASGTYTFTYDNLNRLIEADTDYSFL